MRLLRAKAARKTLLFYRVTFGLTAPYKVLVDGNFLHHALANVKTSILPRLQRLLGREVRLFVARSVAAELEGLGDKCKAALAFCHKHCTLVGDGQQTVAAAMTALAETGEYVRTCLGLFTFVFRSSRRKMVNCTRNSAAFRAYPKFTSPGRSWRSIRRAGPQGERPPRKRGTATGPTNPKKTSQENYDGRSDKTASSHHRLQGRREPRSAPRGQTPSPASSPRKKKRKKHNITNQALPRTTPTNNSNKREEGAPEEPPRRQLRTNAFAASK